LLQHAKTGKNITDNQKIYQRAIKYGKGWENIPRGHKIKHHLPLQDPSKFSQIWLFG
jgi:hypothetical protein